MIKLCTHAITTIGNDELLQVTRIFRQSWNIEILYNKLVVTTRAMNDIEL